FSVELPALDGLEGARSVRLYDELTPRAIRRRLERVDVVHWTQQDDHGARTGHVVLELLRRARPALDMKAPDHVQYESGRITGEVRGDGLGHGGIPQDLAVQLVAHVMVRAGRRSGMFHRHAAAHSLLLHHSRYGGDPLGAVVRGG